MRILPLAAAALLAAAFVDPHSVLGQAAPQQGPGWFIPGGGPHPATSPPPAVRPAPAPARPAPAAAPAPAPIPQLPALPKGQPPPAAVMGVLSVPDVYRQSTAVQAAEKIIAERRKELDQDAAKEQAVWRQMQDALAHDRPKLTPEQIRTRESTLQERITKAQKEFSGRNQQIQEAAQVAIGEVNRMLVAVIRQVAESRGMNLVLHREQVALNMNTFDITDEVAAALNKVLPHVTVPPNSAMPVGQQAPAPAAGVPEANLPVPPTPTATGSKP